MTEEQLELENQSKWAVFILDDWIKREKQVSVEKHLCEKADRVIRYMEQARDTVVALRKDWLAHVDTPKGIPARQIAQSLRELADQIETEEDNAEPPADKPHEVDGVQRGIKRETLMNREKS